jgi:hypothetical protein
MAIFRMGTVLPPPVRPCHQKGTAGFCKPAGANLPITRAPVRCSHRLPANCARLPHAQRRRSDDTCGYTGKVVTVTEMARSGESQEPRRPARPSFGAGGSKAGARFHCTGRPGPGLMPSWAKEAVRGILSVDQEVTMESRVHIFTGGTPAVRERSCIAGASIVGGRIVL